MSPEETEQFNVKLFKHIDSYYDMATLGVHSFTHMNVPRLYMTALVRSYIYLDKESIGEKDISLRIRYTRFERRCHYSVEIICDHEQILEVFNFHTDKENMKEEILDLLKPKSIIDLFSSFNNIRCTIYQKLCQ